MTATPAPVSQKIVDAIRRELIVLAPLVVSFLAVLEGTDWSSPAVWAPVVVNVLLRFFVTTPTHEVEARVDAAHDRGYRVGEVVGRSQDR